MGDSADRRDADGAGQLPLRPGRGALLQEDRVGGRDLHGRHDDHRHEDLAQVLRGRVREDGDGRRRHGGAHAHRRLGGAREDDPRGHDGDAVVGVRIRAPGPPGLGGGGDGRRRQRAGRARLRPVRGAARRTTGRRSSPGRRSRPCWAPTASACRGGSPGTSTWTAPD